MKSPTVGMSGRASAGCQALVLPPAIAAQRLRAAQTLIRRKVLEQSIRGRLLHCCERLVDTERRRFLARREVPEGCQELAHDGLRRNQQIGPVDEPALIGTRLDVGTLE